MNNKKNQLDRYTTYKGGREEWVGGTYILTENFARLLLYFIRSQTDLTAIVPYPTICAPLLRT